MPGVPVDILVFEHGVRYRQTVTSTKVQQQNITRAHIMVAMLPNHIAPSVYHWPHVY